MARVRRVQVIDSHTEGEPTRVVIDGGPDLCGGSTAEQLVVFRDRYEAFRTSIVSEPRGSDVLVGALLVTPADASCAAGVIFFNNVGYLGMCGHGTIGVVATLAHLGRVGPGEHRIETPVGVVTAYLHDNGAVSVKNVPSFRYRKDASVDVPGHGFVTGDVAWGGNWFFLVENHGQELKLSNAELLTSYTRAIREALSNAAITGAKGQEIDHIELFGPPTIPGAQSRNFVLCPGKAFDRSPCGTGTSAKLACLYADGKLEAGIPWRQEGILGSYFDGKVEVEHGMIVPIITGRSYITIEATLLFDRLDPFTEGIG